MGQYQDELKSIARATEEIRERIPDVYGGFSDTYRAVYRDDALTAVMKELLAVAIAISQGCHGCIVSHVRGAVRKGVTDEQFAEMIGVTIQMGGGPASVYAPVAWDAYQEFKERYG